MEITGEEVTWVHSHVGNRPYIDYDAITAALGTLGLGIRRGRRSKALGRYIWNQDYRPTPARLAFTPEEQAITAAWAKKGPFVILEPYIKSNAPPAKRWAVERYHAVALKLAREVPVFQIGPHDRATLPGLQRITPVTFREAIAYMKAAALYIGPEGGLHHAAAAVDTRGVVIFGGFIPPEVTGYPDLHVNLTGGATVFCGTRFSECPHCVRSMDRITIDEVAVHARRQLETVHAGTR